MRGAADIAVMLRQFSLEIKADISAQISAQQRQIDNIVNSRVFPESSIEKPVESNTAHISAINADVAPTINRSQIDQELQQLHRKMKDTWNDKSTKLSPYNFTNWRSDMLRNAIMIDA